MPDIELKMIGPNRYCPDCGHILFEMRDDEEMFRVHDKATIVAMGSVELPEGETPDEIEIIPEAYCLRMRCRYKRWRRGERIPPPPLDIPLAVAGLHRRVTILAIMCGLLALNQIALSVLFLFGK